MSDNSSKQLTVPHEYYDIPSEQAVIATLLAADASQIYTEVGKVVEVINADDFYDPKHQIIFTEIVKRFEQGQNIDPLSVLTAIRAEGNMPRIGGIDYVKSILDPSNIYYIQDDITVYANIVLEESKRRKLYMLGRHLEQLSHPDSGVTVAESITKAESAVRVIADSTVKTDAKKTADFSENLLEQIRLRKDIPEGATVGIPSGFVDLDRKTSGWKPGQFIIIAARPAMGKALSVDTKIPTPSGWKTMLDLKTGDYVYSPSGEAIQVTHTTEVMLDRDCYKLTFSNNSTMIADGSHEWGIGSGDVVIVSTTEELYKTHTSNPSYPLELPDILSIDVNSNPTEEQCESLEIDVYTYICDGIIPDIKVPWNMPYSLKENMIKDAERALKDYENSSKFSPEEAMKIEEWIYNIEASMGQKAPVYITKIEKSVSVPVKCIQVSSDDHFYLAGDFIPTHNSTIALDFARTAAIVAKKTVVMFSLEMGKEELLEKVLAAESRIPSDLIKTGKLDDEQWEELNRAKKIIDNSNLIIDDSADGITLSHIRTVLQRQKNSPEGLDMAVIDYIQLMSGAGNGRKSENRQQEVSELSRGIKLLAKELGIPIFGLSQLNRGNEHRTDKRPLVSDLRESGSLEQDADMILLLHRPEVYDKDDSPSKAYLNVGKQRNGATGEVELTSLLHISKFANAAGAFQQQQYDQAQLGASEDPPPPPEDINYESVTPPSDPGDGRDAW